jgi:hypothetical protein
MWNNCLSDFRNRNHYHCYITNICNWHDILVCRSDIKYMPKSKVWGLDKNDDYLILRLTSQMKTHLHCKHFAFWLLAKYLPPSFISHIICDDIQNKVNNVYWYFVFLLNFAYQKDETVISVPPFWYNLSNINILRVRNSLIHELKR